MLELHTNELESVIRCWYWSYVGDDRYGVEWMVIPMTWNPLSHVTDGDVDVSRNGVQLYECL